MRAHLDNAARRVGLSADKRDPAKSGARKRADKAHALEEAAD
jgi:hypothetical protein